MRVNFNESIKEAQIAMGTRIIEKNKEQQRLEQQKQKEQQQLEKQRQNEMKQKEREEIKYLQNHILFLIKNEKFTKESLKEIDNFIENKRKDK